MRRSSLRVLAALLLATGAAFPHLAGNAGATDAGGNYNVEVLVGGANVIGQHVWVGPAGKAFTLVVQNKNTASFSALGPTANFVGFGMQNYDVDPKIAIITPTAGSEAASGSAWTASTERNGGGAGPDYAKWVPTAGNSGLSSGSENNPGETGIFPVTLFPKPSSQVQAQTWSVNVEDDQGGTYGDGTIQLQLGFDSVNPSVSASFTDGSYTDLDLYHNENAASPGITFTASDATSGLARLAFTADNGATPPLPQSFQTDSNNVGRTTPATVTVDLSAIPEGFTTYTMTATDVAGNTAQTSILVKMDRTPPSSSIFADAHSDGIPDLPNSNGWFKVHPAIRIDATDCLSDCAGLGSLAWWQEEDAGAAPDLSGHPPYLVFTAHPALPDGISNFTAQAADAAHAPNLGAPVHATFRVDTVQPSVGPSFTLEPAPGHATGHTLRFDFADATSRLQAVTLSYAGSQGASNGNVPCAQAFAPNTTSYACVLAIPVGLDVGRHSYTATATDMAGNVATRQAILVRGSPSQPPQASFPAPAPPPPPDDGGGGGGGADPDAALRLAPVKASFTGVPVASRVTLQARAGDADHAPLAGRAVEWRVVSGSGTLSASATPTDGSGIAAVVLTPGGTPGTVRVNASLAGRDAAFTVTTAAGPAARIAPVGPAVLEATAGTRHEVRAQVADAHGNPVPGHAVQWRLAGPGSLSAPATTTGADGIAAVTLALGPAGTTTVSAASNALAGSPVTYTLHAKAPARLATAREVLTVPLGSPQDLQVVARDAAGAPRAGVPVAWSLLRGVGELAQPTSVTGQDGTASVAFTPLVGGLLEVQAASPGLAGSPVIFTVTALVPDPPAGEEAPPSWTQAIRDAGRIQLPDGVLALERTPAGLLAGLRDRSGTLATVRSDPQLGLVLLQVQASGALVLVQADGRAFPVRPQHGTLLGDAADPANRSRELTVSVPAKEGWILVDVEDPHPDHAIAGLRDLAGRILPAGLAWRHQGSLFFLDEPGTTYAIRMQEAPADRQHLDAGAAALWAVGAAAGLAALAWAARRAGRRHG